MYKISNDTLFVGQKIVLLSSCTSTNTYAVEGAERGDYKEGTVVITHHQTHGKGQRGHTWNAEPYKNLTFSVVFKPTFLSVRKQFLLNMAVSLAVRKCLNAYVKKFVVIKWPNDILIANRKLAGILVESQLREGYCKQSVVGVGINVNQKTFLVQHASSLSLLTGKYFYLPDMLSALLKQMEVYYLKVVQGHHQRLKEEYEQSLFGLNVLHNFDVDGIALEGTIRGVNDEGGLLLDVDGQERCYYPRQLRLLQ